MDIHPEHVMSLVPPCNEVFITSDMSHQQVALLMLTQSLFKKYQPRGTNKAADKAALDLFIESNDRCKEWQPDEGSLHHQTMLKARELLHRRLMSSELQGSRITIRNCIGRLRPGPGSSQGTKHTDFVGKVFNSKLTTYDKRLWEYYRDSIGGNWQLAEKSRESQFGTVEVVEAARMTFAKKNSDISRAINTEASLDMMFQLGLGSQIEDCIEDWFNINLSTQPTIHRFLARLGSLYGSHATIDLKSASDLIAYSFVKWFMPPRLFQSLSSVRAKCITLPSGEVLKLSMFSTMGNGYTFPLQTLIFSCIVEAAYLELGLPTCNSEMVPAFTVFGDDIICVKHAYDKVISLLEWCGFTVNKTKSFNSGGFRESCGSDFYRGRDVRGVYCKGLYHETHVYSLFNRLTRWSCRHGIDISELLRFLLGQVAFRPVPFDVGDDSGIKVPLALSGLPSPAGRTKYTMLVRKEERRSTRPYEDNSAGLLVGALGGFISGTGQSSVLKTGNLVRDSVFKPYADGYPTGGFIVRAKPNGVPKYKTKRCFTPSWDWIPQKWLTTTDYSIALLTVLQ